MMQKNLGDVSDEGSTFTHESESSAESIASVHTAASDISASLMITLFHIIQPDLWWEQDNAVPRKKPKVMPIPVKISQPVLKKRFGPPTKKNKGKERQRGPDKGPDKGQNKGRNGIVGYSSFSISFSPFPIPISHSTFPISFCHII